ncbi:MAG: hypothetical protein JJE27_08300, partial [Thermoleophilia bacterium]|nr:hypothetical protein [Thermoleophilia bacterium]
MSDVAVAGSAVATSAIATEGVGAAESLDFQIVPRAGLPIVAVVLALLIAGIASNELWAVE